MNGKEWSKDEESYLIENYSNTDNKIITRRLNRSLDSVKNRARKLGLMKSQEAYQKARKETFKEKAIQFSLLNENEVPKEELFKHKDWLKRNYIDNRMSALQISRKFGVRKTTILHWLEFHGIRRRKWPDSLTDEGRRRISETSRERRGEKNPKWIGGYYYDNGYKYVKDDNHPNKSVDGYVAEHRLVMEFILGRLLSSEEIVHHRDGNRSNNFTSNLFLFPDVRSHAKFHAYKKFVNQDIGEEEFMRCVYEKGAY